MSSARLGHHSNYYPHKHKFPYYSVVLWISQSSLSVLKHSHLKGKVNLLTDWESFYKKASVIINERGEDSKDWKKVMEGLKCQ